MRHVRLLAALGLVLALPSCVLSGALPGGGTPDPDAEAPNCGAAGYQSLIGRERAAAEELQTVQPKRVYGPDEAVTMDYDPDRVNFVIGEDGNIAEVRCG
jgi:hypothetical protein